MKYLKTFESFGSITHEEVEDEFNKLRESINEVGLEIVGEYTSGNGIRLFFTKKSFQKLVIEAYNNGLKWNYIVLDINGEPFQENDREKAIKKAVFLFKDILDTE